MEKLVSLLLAFKMYVKQFHWTAKGYEIHILADRLEEDLDDYIDEAAELYSVNNEDNKKLLSAEVLMMAQVFVAGKYQGDETSLELDSLLQLSGEILEICSRTPEAVGAVEQGYKDYYGRLSNLMVRKCYLIHLQQRKR